MAARLASPVLVIAAVGCGSATVVDPGIGDPCAIPDEDPAFDGYSLPDVTVLRATGPGAGGTVCLAYHFQGLATCPYGQSADGSVPAGASACTTSDGRAVQGAVPAQCVDRPASKVVFRSCRCANAEGRTDDGASYCTCPAPTVCAPAFVSGATARDVAGSYCIRSDATYDPASACAVTCDPQASPCP